MSRMSNDQNEAKKIANAEKKAAFKAAQKLKPFYKRRWFIISCIVVVFGIFSFIYTGLQPKITSISAIYNGPTVEGTEISSSDFTVKAKYDNGEEKQVDSFTLENDDKLILYNQTYVAVISCTDNNNQEVHKTEVTIKCDTKKTYTVEDNMGTLKYLAKQEVTMYMKDPDSAKYKNITASQVGDNTFAVIGYVSGTNSFGATVTSQFSMTIELGILDENAFPIYDITNLVIGGDSIS